MPWDAYGPANPDETWCWHCGESIWWATARFRTPDDRAPYGVDYTGYLHCGDGLPYCHYSHTQILGWENDVTYHGIMRAEPIEHQWVGDDWVLWITLHRVRHQLDTYASQTGRGQFPAVKGYGDASTGDTGTGSPGPRRPPRPPCFSPTETPTRAPRSAP